MRRPTLSLLIYSLATLSVFGLFLVGLSLVSQVEDAGHRWDRYTARAIAMDEALHETVRHFGYGGAIHHFKNFVLRRDEALLPALQEELAATQRALAELRRLSDDEQMSVALDTLEQVVTQYADRLPLAQQLAASGLDPQQIDQQIRVDDRPAVAAIAWLQAYVESQVVAARREADAALAGVADMARVSALLFIPLLLLAVLLIRDRRAMALAHEQAARAQRYFSELIEAMPDALLIVDESGAIVRVNLQAEQLLGYGREQLVGMQVEQLLPEHLRAAHVGMRGQAFASVTARPMKGAGEFRVQCADGSELPVSISLSFSLQDSGRLALVSLRDISEQRRMAMALQKEHEALQMAQALTHLGSWEWDLRTGTHAWSEEMFRLLGLDPATAQASSRSFLRHVHPADRRRFTQILRQAMQGGGSQEVDCRIIRDDGSERYVHGQARAIRDAAGRVTNLHGTLHDVTERKLYEHELRLDQAIIDQVSQPILVTDQDSRIVDANDAFCQMSGYTAVELLGHTPAMMKSGLHNDDYYQQMWDALQVSGRWQGEVWVRTKAGEVFPWLMSISRVCDEDAATCRYVALYANITALKEDQARLENLAHFDALTGLANRILFQDRLRAAMARARRSHKMLALMYLDLDGFKAVNDLFGHQKGDEVLVVAAARLTHAVREDDTVARLGGDEFALILNDVDDRGEVAELAGRLLHELQIEIQQGDQRARVSGSLGIALYPADGEDSESLVEHADEAMYRAKQMGKNRFAFFSNASGD